MNIQGMKDWLAIKVAWLLPKSVVYWCAVRAGAYATTGPWSGQSVPELTVDLMLERWDAQDT